MIYRRLHKEELAELEAAFVRYLAANSIPAEDWERYKTQAPDKVAHHLDTFSDLVFERTLSDVQWLELKTPHDLCTFRCLPDKIEMIGLLAEGAQDIDFTRPTTPEQMMAQVRASNAKLKLYRAERSYRKARNLELFDLMEQGALISKEGDLFKALKQVAEE